MEYSALEALRIKASCVTCWKSGPANVNMQSNDSEDPALELDSASDSDRGTNFDFGIDSDSDADSGFGYDAVLTLTLTLVLSNHRSFLTKCLAKTYFCQVR